MSAVLRAADRRFDAAAYLAAAPLPVCAVHHRGEPRFPASQPTGPAHDQSGVTVPVTNEADGGFGPLTEQVIAAVAFLRANADAVRRLAAFPGVEGVTLAFDAAWRGTVTHSDHMPAELAGMCGGLGLAIEVPHHPAAAEAD